MVVEMTYGAITVDDVSAQAFQSDKRALEIIDAYKSGKNVVFHFQPDPSIGSSEAAVSMIGYFAEYDTDTPGKYSPIAISEIVTLGEGIQTPQCGVINGYFCVVAIASSPGPVQ